MVKYSIAIMDVSAALTKNTKSIKMLPYKLYKRGALDKVDIKCRLQGDTTDISITEAIRLQSVIQHACFILHYKMFNLSLL